MRNRKGFTLIELMVVIFIVGILAAVAIPIMRGRIDAAKWSEGKSAAGSIRTAARAYCAERGPTFDYSGGVTLADLGFAPALNGNPADLDGKYFVEGDYQIALTGYDQYVVTVTAGGSAEAPKVPGSITLDQDGVFTEIP